MFDFRVLVLWHLEFDTFAVEGKDVPARSDCWVELLLFRSVLYERGIEPSRRSLS